MNSCHLTHWNTRMHIFWFWKLANCIVFVFTVNLKALVFWNLLVKSLSRLSAGACLWNSWNSKVGFSCNDHHLFCEETIQIYHLKLFKAPNGLFNHPIVKRPAPELKITRFFVLIACEDDLHFSGFEFHLKFIHSGFFWPPVVGTCFRV